MTFKEAQPFLKPGMRIRIVSSQCSHVNKGDEYVIEEEKSGGYYGVYFYLEGSAHCLGYEKGYEDKIEILTNPDGSKWIHPDKHQFKVGDRVRLINSDGYNRSKGNKIGDIFTVTRVFDDKSGVACDTDVFGTFEIEKIESSDEPKMPNITALPKSFYVQSPKSFMTRQEFEQMFYNESLTQKVTNKMSSLISKLKDLKLSKEDRILREQGLEDENGKMTGESRAMMQEELFQERWDSRRKEVAADLLKLKSEEK